jgi:c(7)-type cytochrome triheme protein
MAAADNDHLHYPKLRIKTTRGNDNKMKYALMLLGIIVVCSIAGNAQAVASGATITFEGRGAGAVVFDGTVHAKKGLNCADCHERHALSPALFPMTKDETVISMRKMELGRSCGYCHSDWVTDMLSCSRCHQK